MVAQNIWRRAAVVDDFVRVNCAGGILDDVLGARGKRLRFADYSGGKRAARDFGWTVPDGSAPDVSRCAGFAGVCAAGPGLVLGRAGFCAGYSRDCIANSE